MRRHTQADVLDGRFLFFCLEGGERGWLARARTRFLAMTTDAIILAREKTNPTFRTEDNAVSWTFDVECVKLTLKFSVRLLVELRFTRSAEADLKSFDDGKRGGGCLSA